IPADVDPKKVQPRKTKSEVTPSPALSMLNLRPDTIKTRKIAFLVADGFADSSVSEMKLMLMKEGAKTCTVAPRLGVLTGAYGDTANADFSLMTGSSVLFDAVYVPDGEESVAALKREEEALNFLKEAFKHCKAIAAAGAGVELLQLAGLPVSVEFE